MRFIGPGSLSLDDRASRLTFARLRRPTPLPKCRSGYLQRLLWLLARW